MTLDFTGYKEKAMKSHRGVTYIFHQSLSHFKGFLVVVVVVVEE